MRSFYLESDDGQRFPLDKDTVVVGRDPAADVSVDDASVSRQHAMLWRKGDAWTVVDNASRNGTFIATNLATKQLKANQATPLELGQTVVFGTARFTLRERAQQPTTAGAPPSPALSTTTAEFAVDTLLPGRAQDNAPAGALDRVLSEVMFRAQQSLFPAQPADALVDALVQLLLAFVPADVAAVQLFDAATGVLRTQAALDKKSHRAKNELLLSRGVAERVMQERKAVLVRDRAHDATFANRQSLVQAGVTSVVAAPIFDGDEVFGVLYAHVTEGTAALSEVDVTVTTLLASLGGTALLAAQMMSDMMQAQAALQRENDRLKDELALLRRGAGQT